MMEELTRQKEIEGYKYRCQVSLEEYRYHLQRRVENFRAVIAMGRAAIRGAFLANGAALIALMAFIANGWRGGIFALPLHGFAEAGLKFVVGLGLALAAQGITYLSQYIAAIEAEHESTFAVAINVLGCTLIAESYGFLIWGGVIVWRVIEGIV